MVVQIQTMSGTKSPCYSPCVAEEDDSSSSASTAELALDDATLRVGSSMRATVPPVTSPSVPLTLRHRVAMLQCVADRWVLQQTQRMVTRGTKERSLRIMTGVIKRYTAAREKVSACNQQARVRSLAKSPAQVD